MEIAHDLGERRLERESYIDNFVKNLAPLLKEEGIEATVWSTKTYLQYLQKDAEKAS